jgi:hypothetical protein
MPALAWAIPPRPTIPQDAPWTEALPLDRSADFSASTVAGSRLVVDNRFGWMWARPSPTKMIWYDAWAYCGNLRAGGFSDWELPGFWQLRSIVDHLASGPYIYAAFNQVHIDHIFWSRDDSISIDQPDWDDRWALFAKRGLFTFERRDEEFHAMCVRGRTPDIQAPAGEERFSEVSTDLILDRRTGLYWTSPRKTSTSRFYMWTVPLPFADATKYCDDLRFAGRSNWRLPNVQELIVIMQPQFRHPMTSMPKLPSSMYPIWTSNSQPRTGYQWKVFANAQVVASDDKIGIFGCVHDN